MCARRAEPRRCLVARTGPSGQAISVASCGEKLESDYAQAVRSGHATRLAIPGDTLPLVYLIHVSLTAVDATLRPPWRTLPRSVRRAAHSPRLTLAA